MCDESQGLADIVVELEAIGETLDRIARALEGHAYPVPKGASSTFDVLGDEGEE